MVCVCCGCLEERLYTAKGITKNKIPITISINDLCVALLMTRGCSILQSSYPEKSIDPQPNPIDVWGHHWTIRFKLGVKGELGWQKQDSHICKLAQVT